MLPVVALVTASERDSGAVAVEACSQLRDPDVMFPVEYDEDGVGNDDLPNDHELVLAAKSVCLGCPVRDLCGEAAMARRERWGVWGGMTHRELEAMRRRLSRKDLRARQLAALQAAEVVLATAPTTSRLHRWAGEIELFKYDATVDGPTSAPATPAPRQSAPKAPRDVVDRFEQLDLFGVNA